jgi:hypothetical protein
MRRGGGGGGFGGLGGGDFNGLGGSMRQLISCYSRPVGRVRPDSSTPTGPSSTAVTFIMRPTTRPDIRIV